MEVLVELGPLLVGRFAVFGFWADAASVVEEGSVGADHVVLEDRQVVLGGSEVGMPEDLGGDMDRQAAGDGFGASRQPEPISKVNSWPQMRMRSPSASVALVRIRWSASSTPLAD